MMKFIWKISSNRLVIQIVMRWRLPYLKSILFTFLHFLFSRLYINLTLKLPYKEHLTSLCHTLTPAKIKQKKPKYRKVSDLFLNLKATPYLTNLVKIAICHHLNAPTCEQTWHLTTKPQYRAKCKFHLNNFVFNFSSAANLR